MLQTDIFQKQMILQTQLEKLTEEIVIFGQKWVGRNLQECISEIAKDFSTISVKRENITFITHHPRRTKKSKIEVEKNRCRLNTYTITKDTKIDEEYNTIIKEVSLGSCIIDFNGEWRCMDTLHFELDDSQEFFIETTVY